VSPALEARNIRWSRAFAITILSVVVLTGALPASAASRIRVYRGETSQEHVIKFQVARTDAGRRYLRQMDARNLSLTCEDGTTQSFGFGYGFGGPYVRIAEGGTFSFEDVGSYGAFRLEGRLGSLNGEGTFSYTSPALTEDEQAQVCTTGDLTWTVEYVRTITRPRF
jgi:hypothetical protein